MLQTIYPVLLTIIELFGQLLAIFVFLFGTMPLSIGVHEAGHLVCGKLSGYTFVSYRILGFIVHREDGKLRFGRNKNGGVAGQCLMAPPEDFGRFRFVLYNMGGGLFNCIFGVLLCVAGFVCTRFGVRFFGYLLYLLALYNFALGATNLLPLSSLRAPNDGLNIKMAKQSLAAAYGLWLMLYLNAKTAEGMRYRDFDPSLFQPPAGADFTNYLVAYIPICLAGWYDDNGETDAAFETTHTIPVEQLHRYYRAILYADWMYYYAVHRRDAENARALYERREVQALFKMKMPVHLRLLAGYNLFVRGDIPLGEKQLAQAKYAMAQFPNKGVRTMALNEIAQLEKAACGAGLLGTNAP